MSDSVIDPVFRLAAKNTDAVISLFDESLEMTGGAGCDLFASVSPSEIALTLFDKKKNRFQALEVFQQTSSLQDEILVKWLSEISGKSTILNNYEASTVHVEMVSELTTLVPSAIFKKEDQEKFFRFNFNKPDLVIHSEPVKGFDAVNVFAVPQVIGLAVDEIFRQPFFHHHSTSLLEGVHLSFKKVNEKTLVLHGRSGFVDVVVAEKGKLLFFNSFGFKTSEDLVYYIMFICDRLQLNPENILTSVSGKPDQGQGTYDLLYKYIRNLSRIRRPDVFEFSYVFREIPEHDYFDLFSLALCES
ncbi:MAG: DUF3822 family protein [Bacteroidetes bacterium]|nr:DUF3822 family protein [Bacteroidota bacterium]